MKLTIKDIKQAERNGISYKTLNRRIHLGWDKERAVSEPIVKPRQYWLKIAKQNGICQRTFDNRIYVELWDYKKAATEPVRKGIKK